MASIFTQIIRGDIPSHKLYEDEYSYAFLDINPLAEGHALVISKREVVSFDELSQDEFLAVMLTVHKLAKKQKQVYGATRIVEMALGFDVDHAHIHVLPLDSFEQYKQAILNHSAQNNEINHERLAEVASKLQL